MLLFYSYCFAEDALMIEFFAGMLVGGSVASLIMACCVAASYHDDNSDRRK